MTFDILQHLDQLEPDGGTNNPRGDHSFKCPHCGAPNFKVHVVTGMWAAAHIPVTTWTLKLGAPQCGHLKL